MMETADDPRPIAFCRKCKADTVLLPNGQCPWCESQVKGSPHRAQVEKLHRERTERRAA